MSSTRSATIFGLAAMVAWDAMLCGLPSMSTTGSRFAGDEYACGGSHGLLLSMMRASVLPWATHARSTAAEPYMRTR